MSPIIPIIPITPIKWWKVSYDFERPFWNAYGRNAFVRADSHELAVRRALTLIRLVESGARMTRLDVSESTRQHRIRFWRLVQANILWRRNMTAGIPNDRRSL